MISGLQQKLVTFDELVDKVSAEEFGAVWFAGGYKSDWIDPETAHAFDSIPLTIVQDSFSSPLWEAAQYQLPGVAFADVLARSSTRQIASNLLTGRSARPRERCRKVS